MNTQPICIYHKDCSDGTAAAAVFLHKFPGAKTFPFAYGYTQEDAKEVLSILTPNTLVYTVDCTILAKECLERGNKVISLDHHIGIFEEMSEFAKTQANYTYIFNNDLSGAGLAWKYFFPDEVMPRWIELVQDKDLYTKKYEDSEYFGNWCYMHTNDPETLLFLFDKENAIEECLEKGRSIDNLNKFYVDTFQEKAEPLFIWYKENKIPCYNSTYLQSALGNILIDPILGVSSVFSIKGNRVRMSVRSVADSQISALEVAKHFGGGGHRNAAGCEMSLADFIAQIA